MGLVQTAGAKAADLTTVAFNQRVTLEVWKSTKAGIWIITFRQAVSSKVGVRDGTRGR
jgi:ligand-binding sensor domain-containing protein